VAPRARGEALDPADRQLLEDLALQAGIALAATRQTRRALRLAADLSRARERLVTAREEERRRLRRDLHDGLGPQLASQTLSLNAATRLIRADPDRAEELLRSLDAQSQQAVADIRELVYGLRPPALDDLGLAGALQQLADRASRTPPHVSIAVDVDPRLPPLSAALEAAAYRIVQEALTNVVRHSGATECGVSIQPGSGASGARGTLVLTISDNGRGIRSDAAQGVGMRSMRERAEELGGRLTVEPRPGGGSRIGAELPLRLEEVQP
jgi:signal transduction histidine kinase